MIEHSVDSSPTPTALSELRPIRRALLSVTDKTGFLNLWNPIAGESGLPQLTVSSI